MHINWFFISNLLLTITTLFLIIIFVIYGKEIGHHKWLIFLISLFIWAIGATLTSLSKTEILVQIFFRIGCASAAFSSALIHHTFFVISKSKNKKILIFSYILSFCFAILILITNLIYDENINRHYVVFLLPSTGKFFYVWFLAWLTVAVYAHSFFINYILKQKYIDYSLLKFFFTPVILGFASATLNFSLAYNIWIGQFGNIGIAINVLILTYAIFRHQTFGIEIAYRKGLIYSFLIAILTAFYLLLIFIMEQFFRGIVGYKSVALSLSSAFLMAILFNPLLNRIQLLVDKLFLGKTHQEISQENELLIQELERSERLKAASTLALGLAHEIRNPLTTIKTFAEFLPEKYEDKNFINKFTKLIPAEVERINNIIHQLLTFSKPSPPSFKDTDIHGLIKDILGFLNSEFLKKKIRISEDYADSTLIIRIDPVQIKQALLNIVFNALDAMPNGGMLSMKTEITNGSDFKIIISDTGYGISKEDLKHIFDPFYSKKDEGTGLGLAITHRIITNHGGTIEAESETGKGTTFIIMIPLTAKISEILG